MADMDLQRLVQHHDGQLEGLNARMGHVEKTLSGHGDLLTAIKDAVTKQDARPSFNIHQVSTTVLVWATLFSMVVLGIIWVTTTQFSPLVQTVSRQADDLKGVQADITGIKEKLSWATRIDPPLETGSTRR